MGVYGFSVLTKATAGCHLIISSYELIEVKL